MKPKKVSVIIPTYKPERTIKKCVESLLLQEYKPVEVIIVDSKFNPITDPEILRYLKKNTKYVKDGPERSIQRNRGLKEAKGEYVYILDQDMYVDPIVIKQAVEYMEKGEYIALTIPEISIGEGYWTECVALERYVNNYLETGLNECCRFLKKSDALKVGGYDPTIVGAEDSDFHYRVSKLGKIGKTKQHIKHDEGHTNFFDRVKKKYYYSKAFRTYLDRYQGAAVQQFSPLKLNYFRHWKEFVKKPHITVGVILLRGSEVTAGVLGLISKK